MRIAATIKLNDMAISTIQLGFVGESNHNKIVFDCEAVFSENPSAIQSITVTPPVGDPYPVVSARVGNNVEWIVGASDVAVEGDGKVQLTFVENNETIKSYEANTTIMVSSVPGQEPTAIADWITAANATLEEVDEAIPTGGTKGQVLAKASNADRDTEWVSYSGSYNDMSDKPQIEGVTLSGDVSLQDLGAAAAEDIPDVSGFYTKPASGIPASDLATGVIPDVSGFYSKPQTGIPATDIADGVIPDVSGFYTKPETGIPASDLATGVIPDVSGFYTKPTEGIPDTDMSTGVRTSLGKADSAYQKPGSGIPAGDLASGVIPDVSGFYTKPASGIPASDIADGVIPDPTEIIDDTAGDGATQLTWSADKIKEETDGLKEAITRKAPAIIVDSEEEYSHSGIAGASKITFKGNSLAFDTAKYADKVNYAPLLDGSETYKDVEFTGTDGFIVANGTASGSGIKLIGYVDFATHLPAGNYKIIAMVDAGESVLDPNNNNQYQIRFIYDDETTLEKNTYIGATDKTWDVTTTKPTKRIAVYAGTVNGVVYASYKSWWGVYDASVTIIDTQQTVSATGSYDLNLSSNNLTAIDTMQHKSIVESMADTKSYIDEKEVNIDEELTYVTPERFGAKGDGTTDDYTALVDCLSYAITNSIPVRALGVYRISAGLAVVCDEMDIFINRLITSATFSGAMFKLTGQRNKVTINTINGYSGDCAGFHLYGVVGHASNYNTIHIPYITVTQNALIVSAETGAYACENEIHTRNIRSGSGNCLQLENGYGENVYFGGGQMICANGWAIHTECDSDHFYNFALEDTSKYGIYVSGYCNTFYGFRIAELRAQRNPENEDGVLIKFVDGARFNIFECGDIINFIDVDVTDASENTDLDATTVRLEGYGINVVRGAGVRPSHANGDAVCFMTTCGREIITLRNQKIMTPFGRMRRTVNGNLDYTTFYGQVYATDYVIKADATIKFNSCFCPVGFNDIVIDQTDGHYATIYDKANNVIFDGSTYGTGVFRLSCVCDMDDNVARDLAPSQSSVLASALMYDGTNETWSVTTISGS